MSPYLIKDRLQDYLICCTIHKITDVQEVLPGAGSTSCSYKDMLAVFALHLVLVLVFQLRDLDIIPPLSLFSLHFEYAYMCTVGVHSPPHPPPPNSILKNDEMQTN